MEEEDELMKGVREVSYQSFLLSTVWGKKIKKADCHYFCS